MSQELTDEKGSEKDYLDDFEGDESGGESMEHEAEISSVRTDSSLSIVQWPSSPSPRDDNNEQMAMRRLGGGNNENEEGEEWEEIEEWLRILFDAWNGRPLTGSQQIIYAMIRRFL